jgi:hypothetical protein
MTAIINICVMSKRTTSPSPRVVLSGQLGRTPNTLPPPPHPSPPSALVGGQSPQAAGGGGSRSLAHGGWPWAHLDLKMGEGAAACDDPQV